MTNFYLLVKRFLPVLFLVSCFSMVLGQERAVTGKVTSADDGSSVPGVNILEKGTNNGTVSDLDGNFKLSVGNNAVLVFSFVGYATQEVTVGAQSVLNVSMQSDVTALQEVVVVGYGTQEKKDVTGVVVAVDSKNFNKGAIASPDQLIAGKIAGVQITPNSGEPGTGGTVRVRGGTSIQASNDPLYVVDGVPLDITGVPGARNPLNFINPNDIETFTVLKDASAAAIYGSRAANGVVIITTKRAKAGDAVRVTYDGFYSSSQIAKQLNVLDGPQFRELVNLVNPSKTALLYDNDASITNKTSTDWQKQILQTAIGQSHNIGFSGGTDKAGIRASIGYFDQSGIIKTSSTKRTTFSLNVNQKALNDNLTIEANMKGSETRDRYNGGDIGTAYSMAPTQPVMDTAKAPLYGGYWEWASVQLGTKNPVANNNMTQNFGTFYRGLGNIKFDYKFDDFVPGLRANMNFGVDVTTGLRQFFQPTNLRLQAVNSFPGSAQTESTNRMNKLFEFYLNYTKNLASIESKIDVTGGYSWQNFYSNSSGYNGTGLTSNAYGFNNPQVATKRDIWTNVQENRLISFFGRVNYSMKDKYLLTVNLRSDGSTRFSEANRWGFFPSAAIGWRIYDEDFASSLKSVFSDLKLRVSWGINGNQEIGNYAYLPTFTPTNGFSEYPFGSTYVSPIRPGAVDPNLKWEQTESLNIGLDFGLLKGRLSGSIEYYNKNTKDLLFVVNVPAGQVPGDQVLTNIGKVNNHGLELTLNAVAIDKKDFRWDLAFNISANINKVESLDGVDDPNFQGYAAGYISGGIGNAVQVLKVGYPVNTYRLFEHLKGSDGKPLVDGVDWNKDGVVDLKDMYKDVNGDGVVNDQDRVPNALAYPAPKAYLGLTSTMTYKNFDFTFTLRSNLGGQVYNNVQSSNGYLNRINELVPQNLPVAALQTNFRSPQYLSNYYLENSTFLRMDNITLGYTVNKNKARIRVYTTVQNAFVVSKYTGLDPEVVNGIDNNLYPRSRTFVVGLNLGL